MKEKDGDRCLESEDHERCYYGTFPKETVCESQVKTAQGKLKATLI